MVSLLREPKSLTYSRSGSSSTTAAAAPSPKRTQVVRSVKSSSGVITSHPSTRAQRLSLCISRPRATCSAYKNPAQAPFKSSMGMPSGRPSRLCSRQAVVGEENSGEKVATTTAPSSSGQMPARSIAVRAAPSARSMCRSPRQM